MPTIFTLIVFPALFQGLGWFGLPSWEGVALGASVLRARVLRAAFGDPQQTRLEQTTDHGPLVRIGQAGQGADRELVRSGDKVQGRSNGRGALNGVAGELNAGPVLSMNHPADH